MEGIDAVVVGAGPAGLATAACLGRQGVDTVVLEKAETVAPAWHNHYERLRLHTNKGASGLPYHPMPRRYPRYPSRDEVARYLVDYARREGLDVRVGTEVGQIHRGDHGWSVATTNGGRFRTWDVVIATGLSQVPVMPTYPGLDGFGGRVMHTADYRNGEPFRGETVLVVGFGNSAGEIALDLIEHGATTRISVRSPSVVVPRDILGIPILSISRFLAPLPPRVADRISRPLLALLVGDISRHGIPKADRGPLEQITTEGKIPLLDVGTIDALEEGTLQARSGIEEFTRSGVVFSDGRAEDFDAVVFGTGYRPGVETLVGHIDGILDDRGRPLVSGDETGVPGLYFCGFREPPTGRLREIGLEARRLAGIIAGRVG